MYQPNRDVLCRNMMNWHFCMTYLLWVYLLSIIIYQTLHLFSFWSNKLVIWNMTICYGFSLIWQTSRRNWQNGVQRWTKTKLLLDINCQADDTPESKTADGYKTHLQHLKKRLKSNGCDAIYTECMIDQCLTELKHIYCRNKKLLICATKDLFTISYVYFFIDLCDLVTTYYSVSRISLPLWTVQRNSK